MESFFGRLKTECIYGRRFETVVDMGKAVSDYIRYYNKDRVRLKLKGLSPIQYRTQSL
ncbi:integrase core domain-containing protein [Neisseria yangbaofengii]